ncbi:F-box/FBD/LRR-repeat protein-like protein, partial [Tanacetum coccineum]
IMKPVHRARNASKLAHEDVISRMPENVITDIMNRFPIRDAMRTSILASNWRFRWTMLTELVFDQNFSKYLQGPNGEKSYDERNISRILLNLICPIKKFYLYIPNYYKVLDVKDISHWVLFLSKKGIKELTITL